MPERTRMSPETGIVPRTRKKHLCVLKYNGYCRSKHAGAAARCRCGCGRRQGLDMFFTLTSGTAQQNPIGHETHMLCVKKTLLLWASHDLYLHDVDEVFDCLKSPLHATKPPGSTMVLTNHRGARMANKQANCLGCSCPRYQQKPKPPFTSMTPVPILREVELSIAYVSIEERPNIKSWGYLHGLKLVLGPSKVRPDQDSQGRALVDEPVGGRQRQ